MSVLILFGGGSGTLSAPAATISVAAPVPALHGTFTVPSAAVINTTAPAPRTFISAPAALINLAAPAPADTNLLFSPPAIISTAAPAPTVRASLLSPVAALSFAAIAPIVQSIQLAPRAIIDFRAPGPTVSSSGASSPHYQLSTRAIDGTDECFLPFTALNWSRTLDDAGEATARINLRDASLEAECVAPGRRDVYIYRYGELVWSGRLWRMDYTGDNELTITASDWYSLLKRRYIRPTDELVFDANDVWTIAWDLISYTQDISDLGITWPVHALRDYPLSRTFSWDQFSTIADLIEQVNQDSGKGWDFYIDQNKEWHSVRRYSGIISPVVLQQGVNIETPVSFSRSAEETMNYIMVQGAGSGKDTVYAVSEDTDFQADYGVLEGVVLRHMRRQADADGVAERKIRTRKFPRTGPVIKFKVNSEETPFTDLELASNVQIIYDDGIITLNDEFYRLAAVAVALTDAGREECTLTFDAKWDAVEGTETEGSGSEVGSGSGSPVTPDFGTMGFTEVPAAALNLATMFYRANSLNGLNGPLPTSFAQPFVDEGYKMFQTLRNSGGTQGAPQVAVIGVIRGGGTLTFQTSSDHDLQVGQAVQIFDFVPTGYNQLFVVEAVPTTDTLRVTYPDPGTPTTLGKVGFCSVYPDDTARGGLGYTDYEDKITDFLTAIGPSNIEYLVLENEGSLNKQTAFYADPTVGPPGPYSVMMSHAVTAAHTLGVKVTNDGILSELVRAGTYMDFIERGLTTEAAAYAAAASVNISQAPARAIKCKQWLDETVLGGADAANIHMYRMTDTQVLIDTVAWVADYTGLPVVCNEFGQKIGSVTADVESTFDGLSGSGIEAVILYAQGGANSEKLRQNASPMSLTPLGQDWADLIA